MSRSSQLAADRMPTYKGYPMPTQYNLKHLVDNVYLIISRSPYHKGQRVLAGGRKATVKSICATGAVDVLTDDGALLTFVDGVVPLVEQPAPVDALVEA